MPSTRAGARIMARLGVEVATSLPQREVLPPVEPLAIAHRSTSTFGTTLLGDFSISDLQDSLKVFAYWMTQMATAYGAVSPAWVAGNSAEFTDWTNDWAALQQRYNTAVSGANSAIAMAAGNPLPSSMISAQTDYVKLQQAMRQCFQPSSPACPVVKGDFDDLNSRLTTATNTYKAPPPNYSATPQPTAPDLDVDVFKATTQADVGAMATGAQVPTGPLAPVATAIAPLLNLLGLGPKKPDQPQAPPSPLKWALVGIGAGLGGIVGAKFAGIAGGLIGAVVGGGTVEVVSLAIPAPPTAEQVAAAAATAAVNAATK